ncbi:MAG: hypothetical protein WCL06_02495 [Bacteroidota bacterium]
MRLTKLLLLLTFLILATFACKKYEDGPAISLRSRKARVVGRWITDKWMIDKLTYTSLSDTNKRIEFADDGSCIFHESNPITHVITDLQGNWSFRENKEQLLLEFSSATDITLNVQLWDILRLKNNEIWLERVDYGFPHSVIYEWRLKAE